MTEYKCVNDFWSDCLDTARWEIEHQKIAVSTEQNAHCMIYYKCSLDKSTCGFNSSYQKKKEEPKVVFEQEAKVEPEVNKAVEEVAKEVVKETIDFKNIETYSYPLSVNEQFFFCGVPFRLDSYSGCSYNCQYCFARALEKTNAERILNLGKIRPCNPNEIKNQLFKALETDKQLSNINTEWLRHKAPIHWGGLSDPFQPIEETYKVSYTIMEYLNKYQYPVVVSTKSTLPSKSPYIERLKEGNYAMQTTLISDDDKLVKLLEPGAPSTTDRLKHLEILANNGIWTACRIQPLIPNSYIESNLENFIAKLASVGVKHIILEGYKPSIWFKEGYNLINEICGGKVKDVFNGRTGSEFFIPSWRKWYYIKPAITQIHKYGMTYGAGDNDFRDFGDVKCCCGIDNLKGFENYWQYQTATVAEIAKRKGICSLDDMNNIWTGEKELRMNANSLLLTGKNGTKNRTLKDFFSIVWGSGDQHSPKELVNLKQVYHNNQVCYEYKNSISTLEKQTCEQCRMF